MSAMSYGFLLEGERFAAVVFRMRFFAAMEAPDPHASARRAAIVDACIKDSVETAMRRWRDSAGADPRLEFRLEDGLRRPPDGARECVEVPEALPVLQRVLLQLPDPFADDRVRRGVARSDDLMRREQLVVDRRPFQPRRAVSPFDEVDQVLLP